MVKELKEQFSVILLGVIFDPKTKKILIGRREKDPYVPKLTWCFPGGRAIPGEELEETLKKKIKQKTGLDIENLGSVSATRIPSEKRNFVLIYYLCEVRGGKETPTEDLKELKWVSLEKLEKYFTTSFHPHLKEYILNLK